MGVISGADEHKLGLDGNSTTALMFDDVKVPVENVLGTIGEGHKVAFNILNLGRVKLGTRNIGGAKQALTGAVKYAIGRKQFGQSDRQLRADQAQDRRDVGALLRRRRHGLPIARRSGRGVEPGRRRTTVPRC